MNAVLLVLASLELRNGQEQGKVVLWFSNCPLLALVMETNKGPVFFFEWGGGGGGGQGWFFRNLMILDKPGKPTISKSAGSTLSALFKVKAVP